MDTSALRYMTCDCHGSGGIVASQKWTCEDSCHEMCGSFDLDCGCQIVFWCSCLARENGGERRQQYPWL